MNQLDKRLYEAFDAVQTDENLKTSTVEFISRMRVLKTTGITWQKRLVAVACMFVILAAGIGMGIYCTPFSIISVDINPSVELGINCFDRVISVEGYNEEGIQLIQDLRLKNKTSVDALTTIITSNMISGLIQQNAFLSITVVGRDSSHNASVQAELMECLPTIENARCIGVLTEEVSKAHYCGMSYGKYLAGLELMEINDDYSLEDVKDMSMQQIRDHCLTSVNGHQKVECGLNGNKESAGSHVSSETGQNKNSSHHNNHHERNPNNKHNH